MGGAPQVLDRNCVRALIDKVDRKQGATEAQRSKKKGQKWDKKGAQRGKNGARFARVHFPFKRAELELRTQVLNSSSELEL